MRSSFGLVKTRVRTQTILQMETAECGAASLGMILAHFGRHVGLEELRYECGVSRDGSSADRLVAAAENYGLMVHAYQAEPQELGELPLPSIIHWGFNHFVVLEGFGRSYAFINDPSSGPRRVPMEEFDENFTGVVLTFERGPNFRKGGRRRTAVQAIFERLPSARSGVIYVLLAGLFLVLPGVVIPTFSRIFVDDILIAGKQEWLIPLVIGMALTAVARAVLRVLRGYALLRLSVKLSVAGTSRAVWKVLSLPMTFFSARFAGDIMNRINANERLAGLVSGDLSASLLNLMTVVFFAALMFIYDPILTLIVVTTSAFNLIVLRFLSRSRQDESRRMQQGTGKLFGLSMGGLQILETLKASGSESEFFARWSGLYANLVNSQQALARNTLMWRIIPDLISAFTTACVLGVGALHVMNGIMSIGMLVAFQSLAASFSAPFRGLLDFGSKLHEADANVSRLDDVLRHPTDPALENPTDEEPEEWSKLSGHLTIRNLTFGYNRNAPAVLEDFSLVMNPGNRIALVGGSGSGKSTVAKLIGALYPPWEGEILYGGRGRDRIARDVVVNSLSLVDQEISLFAGTVRENITMWDATIPEQEIIRAAKDACIHDDIVSRVGGYESRLTEGGSNLSGGQRQRLEIARALVRSPTLLILDEATSALDPVTEKQVDDNIRRRGCTCLIIAHRLSTVRDCDEIVVLDEGRVVQRGVHEELNAVDGVYQRLVGTM